MTTHREKFATLQERMKALFQDMDLENQILETKRDESVQEKKQLSEDVEKAVARVSQLEEQLKLKNLEVKELKEVLASRPSSFKDDPNVRKMLSRNEERIKLLEKELESVDALIDSHKLYRRTLEESLDKRYREKAELQKENDRLGKELDEAKTKIRELEIHSIASQRSVQVDEDLLKHVEAMTALLAPRFSQTTIVESISTGSLTPMPTNSTQHPSAANSTHTALSAESPIRNSISSTSTSSLRQLKPEPAMADAISSDSLSSDSSSVVSPPYCNICYDDLEPGDKVSKCQKCKADVHDKCFEETGNGKLCEYCSSEV